MPMVKCKLWQIEMTMLIKFVFSCYKYAVIKEWRTNEMCWQPKDTDLFIKKKSEQLFLHTDYKPWAQAYLFLQIFPVFGISKLPFSVVIAFNHSVTVTRFGSLFGVCCIDGVSLFDVVFAFVCSLHALFFIWQDQFTNILEALE